MMVKGTSLALVVVDELVEQWGKRFPPGPAESAAEPARFRGALVRVLCDTRPEHVRSDQK